MTVPLVFALAGQGAAMAFLISTIGVLLVALNVNQFARMSASPGSLYTYITDHMHPRWGVLAGWALLIAYVGTACGRQRGRHELCQRDPARSLRRAGVSVAADRGFVTVVACYLAYRDVQISARLMLWLQAASVALISVIAIASSSSTDGAPTWGRSLYKASRPEKLRLGLVLAIFSSVGFESATSLGSEAKNPLTSIPRAVKWSAILAGVFFFLCAYAEVLAFRGATTNRWTRVLRRCMYWRSRSGFRRSWAHSPIWARW